jgi:hypothetical protein
MGIVKPNVVFNIHFDSLFCSCWCIPVEEQEHFCWCAWWCHCNLDPLWIAWLPSSDLRLSRSHILPGCSLSLVQCVRVHQQVRFHLYIMNHTKTTSLVIESFRDIEFMMLNPYFRAPPHIPEVIIPEDVVLNMALSTRYEINRAFANLRQIALSQDVKKFLMVLLLSHCLCWTMVLISNWICLTYFSFKFQVIAGIWLLSVLGGSCNFLTLVYVGKKESKQPRGNFIVQHDLFWVTTCLTLYSLFLCETVFVVLHTVPVLYEKYEDQIDSHGEKAWAEIRKQYAVFDANVLSKVPRGLAKDKKH